MSHSELKKILKYWIPILKLKDWDIQIQYDPSGSPDGYGKTKRSYMAKKAYIFITPEDKLNKEIFSLASKDIETTIVHELIHLMMSPIDTFQKDSPGDLFMENVIETLAMAFINEKRKNETKK